MQIKNHDTQLFIAPASLAFYTIITTLMLITTPVATSFAQGTAFAYQGQLNNGTNPATGSYDLTFTLFGASSGGSPLAGPLTNAAVGVSNGLFAVLVDFGPGVFTGASNWLSIGVRSNGLGAFTVLSPRQQLTPTPYAIFAEGGNAAGLSGTIPAGDLTGTYGGAITLSNLNNSFAGNGSGLTNVNATTLGGLSSGNFWQVGGNVGVPTGSNFVGNTDNQYLDLRANGVRAMRLRVLNDGLGIYSNAPNVIGGSSVNLTAPNVVGGTIAGGGGSGTNGTAYVNEVFADFGAIGGGAGNSTGGRNATVSGGYGNNSGGAGSFIGGGGYDGTTFSGNTIQDNAATIGGGLGNYIPSGGTYSFIGGGESNLVSVGLSTLGGGYRNTVGNAYVFLGGGFENTASGPGAIVVGGALNTASWPYATVVGGVENIASGTTQGYSTVGGGETNGASGDFSFIGGGVFNNASGTESVIGGGMGNTNNGFMATIGGGQLNVASGLAAAVAGGSVNVASGAYSTIAGGFGNSAVYQAAVGGGSANTASGFYSTMPGGFDNVASGYYSTVAGGNANAAGGNASFAAGQYAQTTHANTYIWGDGSQDPFTGANADNAYNVLATGGLFFYDGTNGVHVDGLGNNNGTLDYGLKFGGAISSGEGVASKRTLGGNQYGLDFYTASADRMSIDKNGNVGINTTSPSQQLEVNGNYVLIDGGSAFDGNGPIDAYIGGSGSGSDVQIGSMNSLITTVGFWNNSAGAWMHIACSSISINGGSDLAEPFPVGAGAGEIPAGTVMVIDEKNPGQLKISDQPYDRRVAGVISGANGINPGIQMRQEGLLEGGRNVALTGRVYVQADASNGAIEPGDLLTTSSTPGHAMKVTDYARAQGAILGKAMTALSQGKGTVLVLVTLQ